MAQRNRLVTLVFSHYNEKARWALDYCGIAYDETKLMPGFSQLGVFLATRGRGGRADAVSSRLSTPVLLADDGATLCDSTDIVRWASARAGGGGPGPLFPDPAVLDLVERFGRELGPHTRLVAYWHAFHSATAFRTLARSNVSRTQALAFQAVSPFTKGLIQRVLGVTAAGHERSLDRVRAQVAMVDARLARRPYLVGDGFTAADLTFAALMVPVLLVSREEGYGATLPALDEFPPAAHALVAEMRGTRAGQFALEMFRRHRHASAFAGARAPAAARPHLSSA